jgi:hypothetical protein
VPAQQQAHAERLHEHYQKAGDECVENIRKAYVLMGTKLMPGQGFDLNFAGEDADE